MPKDSAGILLYRIRPTGVEVFLVHPGGPFFVNRDDGIWSVPKGLLDPAETHFEAAKREFAEETGQAVEGEFIPLEPVRQANGKIVHAWAVEGDIDATAIRSNTFPLEWPPKSGRIREFPEIDRGAWFSVQAARRKVNSAQMGLIDQLLQHLQVT
jgi:predicted NUDIX family NTP pyrophosphohydrolase